MTARAILEEKVVDGTARGEGVLVRVVAEGTWRHLELRGKDRTGGPRWDTITSVNLADTPAHQFPSNIVAPSMGQALFFALSLLNELAVQRAALARTMTYSPADPADDAPRGHGGL